MSTVRLTAGQALIRYLINQHVERDGETQPFFAGIWGIFGHGNIGGLAQAIQQYEDDFPYYLGRNEQAMVHTAIAYAKMKNRTKHSPACPQSGRAQPTWSPVRPQPPSTESRCCC